MWFRSTVVRMLLTLSAALIGANAQALPKQLKTAHPHLYATAAELDALRTRLRIVLPSSGSILLKFTPALAQDSDVNSALLAGSFNDTVAHFGLRYGGVTNGQIDLLATFFPANSGAQTRSFRVSPDVETTITINYQPNAIEIKQDGAVVATFTGITWDPTKQRFFYVGRKAQQTSQFLIKDAQGITKWDGSTYDWNLGAAYFGLIEYHASAIVTKINACGTTPTLSPGDYCNVVDSSRTLVMEGMKQLAIAYQISGIESFYTTARKYADLILSMENYVPPNSDIQPGLAAGDEWGMSARVSALGVFYDWFYQRIGLDNDGVAYRARLRKAILDTIRTDSPKLDLIAAICGRNIKLNAAQQDCASQPVLDQFYIQGHEGSAMTSSAMGLLAINPEDGANTAPLIDRIYTHLVSGILPARDYIGQDGGNHMLFAYGLSGELIERLIMWKRVFEDGDSLTELERPWIQKTIRPFIYGLRDATTFPVTGDAGTVDVKYPQMGYMALAAATRGDAQALTFYNERVLQRSRSSSTGVWEALYFPPATVVPAPLCSLRKAEHFSIAGNVFMRDSWDYENATLLDFKSTKFSSENHQHLDQNSFSLFYKAPLLVDSGYGGYNSPHWTNYYRRTIAHNSILVFNSNEQYPSGHSNDGGQWYKGVLYPALRDIIDTAADPADGANVLDGIDRFGNDDTGDTYAYVRANAGKSYLSPTPGAEPRLDPTDGFRRHIIFLRKKDSKPVVLVYDRVHTNEKNTASPAISLLHTVERPVTNVIQTEMPNTPGRYAVAGSTNPPLVVRNGDAKLTIEPILPTGAFIKVVGSEPEDVPRCIDFAGNPSDCRYTVRMVNNGVAQWRNFPVSQTGNQADQRDFGNWRIEISQVEDGVPETWRYQYFLNILRVQDNDGGVSAPAAKEGRLLGSSDFSAHAVELDGPSVSTTVATTVVFSANFPQARSLRWKPSNHKDARFIAEGLIPNTMYSKWFDSGKEEWVLEQGNLPQAVLKLTSSAAGVVQNLASEKATCNR